MERPLTRWWPSLARAVRFVAVADLPTPVEPLVAAAPDAFVKRDDLSSAIYGGNKVRSLETLLGDARHRGATHIYATGAFGSNQAVATILHAPRAELTPGAILFPQPPSASARANLRVIVDRGALARALPHWSALPVAMALVKRAARRRGERASVMIPGGATPMGAVGYVSAALELAEQCAVGQAPAPRTVVIAVGSTCTSAGLLLGFAVATRRRFGFVDGGGRPQRPRLVSARVTPWPVTAAWRIVGLAARTGRWLADVTGDQVFALTPRDLAVGLEVDGRFLGRGYGFETRAGRAAIAALDPLTLDPTYTAKSAAALLARPREGPTIYWATKSSAPLPAVRRDEDLSAPAAVKRWLAARPSGIDT